MTIMPINQTAGNTDKLRETGTDRQTVRQGDWDWFGQSYT